MSEPLITQGHMRLKLCRYGPMLYPITDTYVGRSLDHYGEYSWAEGVLFQQLVSPDQSIVDAGANIGVHTIHLAKLIGPQGRVFAFEPQRVIFQILCANVALNALANVHAKQAALGAEPGIVLVPEVNYGEEGNFGGVALGECEQGEEVPIETIDDMELDACDLIKVDVEGMESDVMMGAEQTIHRFHPILYVENNRRDKALSLIEQLLMLKYRLGWDLPPLFNPRNFFAATKNIFGETVSHNMLCLPPGDTRELQGFSEIQSPGDVPW